MMVNLSYGHGDFHLHVPVDVAIVKIRGIPSDLQDRRNLWFDTLHERASMLIGKIVRPSFMPASQVLCAPIEPLKLDLIEHSPFSLETVYILPAMLNHRGRSFSLAELFSHGHATLENDRSRMPRHFNIARYTRTGNCMLTA